MGILGSYFRQTFKTYQLFIDKICLSIFYSLTHEQSIDKKREAIRQKGEVKNLAKGKNQGFVMKRLSSFSSGTGQNRSFDSNQSDDVQIKVTENSVKSKRERMKNFRFHSVQE